MVYLVTDDENHTATIKEEIEIRLQRFYTRRDAEIFQWNERCINDCTSRYIRCISFRTIIVLVILYISVVERTKVIGVLKAIRTSACRQSNETQSS